MNRSLFLLCLCLLILLCYWPGITGGFRFDDIPNIVQNSSVHVHNFSANELLKSMVGGNSSILKRPVSMLSFGLNHAFSGLHASAFSITNVILHSINSILVYVLISMLCKQSGSESRTAYLSFFPAAVAASWALSPINVTAVLYIVQRMASLSALFSFLAIIVYLWSRQTIISGRKVVGLISLLIVIVLIFLSVLSKETGALTVLYLFLMELVLFESIRFRNRDWLCISFFTVFLFIPLLVIGIYTLSNPAWISNSYAQTEFTLLQRLFTEARVLWLYVFWMAIPVESNLALFHDDISYSIDLFNPMSTVFAIAAHVLVITFGIVLLYKNKLPWLVFGLFLFYSAHLIESTVIGLELVHEHRNYVAGIGFWLALWSGFSSLTHKFAANKLLKVVWIFVGIYFLLMIFVLYQRSSVWGNDYETVHVDVINHPNSSAANYELGRLYAINFEKSKKQNDLKRAIDLFQRASELNPNRADAIFAIVMIQAKNNMEIDEKMLTELNEKLSNGPFYASHASWLTSLVQCFNNRLCRIPTDKMQLIIASAIENKNIHTAGISKAVALTAAASFVGNNGGSYKNALELSIEAEKSAPTEMQFLFNIIHLAVANKDVVTAEDRLAKIKIKNKFGMYDDDIIRFEKVIGSMKK